MSTKRKRSRLPLSKHWCYTINNPTTGDAELIEKAKRRFVYHVCGREVGEDGTLHMQGYVVFLNRCRLPAVKKVFPRAHLEIKKGTSLQASNYCKKDGHFIEDGKCPMTLKKRNEKDWSEAYKAAKEGRLDDIPRDMYLRYRNNVMLIHCDSCDFCSKSGLSQVFSCLSTYSSTKSFKTN